MVSRKARIEHNTHTAPPPIRNMLSKGPRIARAFAARFKSTAAIEEVRLNFERAPRARAPRQAGRARVE